MISKLGRAVFLPAKAVKETVQACLLVFLWLLRAESVLFPLVPPAVE